MTQFFKIPSMNIEITVDDSSLQILSVSSVNLVKYFGTNAIEHGKNIQGQAEDAKTAVEVIGTFPIRLEL